MLAAGLPLHGSVSRIVAVAFGWASRSHSPGAPMTRPAGCRVIAQRDAGVVGSDLIVAASTRDREPVGINARKRVQPPGHVLVGGHEIEARLLQRVGPAEDGLDLSDIPGTHGLPRTTRGWRLPLLDFCLCKPPSMDDPLDRRGVHSVEQVDLGAFGIEGEVGLAPVLSVPLSLLLALQPSLFVDDLVGRRGIAGDLGRVQPDLRPEPLGERLDPRDERRCRGLTGDGWQQLGKGRRLAVDEQRSPLAVLRTSLEGCRVDRRPKIRSVAFGVEGP